MNYSYEAEGAWAAGIFEGEGCVSVSHSAIVIKLSMCDEDVVYKWGCVLGCGKHYGPYPPRGNGTKPQWQWSVARIKDVEAVYERFRPWLSARRIKQFEDAFEAYHKKREDRAGYRESGYRRRSYIG